MAKRKIGDVVADGVLDTELAVVRAARQAVQAVNRNLRAAKRKVTGKKAKRKVTGRKKAAKKTARRAVSKDQTRGAEDKTRGAKGHQENRQTSDGARPASLDYSAIDCTNYAGFTLVIDPLPGRTPRDLSRTSARSTGSRRPRRLTGLLCHVRVAVAQPASWHHECPESNLQAV